MRKEKPNKTWMRMSLGRIRREMMALVKEDQEEMTSEEEMTLSLLRKIADYRLERFSMLADCVSSGMALQISFSVVEVVEGITTEVYHQRCTLTMIFIVGLIALSLILGNILAQHWRDRETLELPVPGLDGEPLTISLKPDSLGNLAANVSKLLFIVASIVILVSDRQTRLILEFVVIILEVISTALFAMTARRAKLVALEALQEIEAKNGPFDAEMVTEIDKKDREARP